MLLLLPSKSGSPIIRIAGLFRCARWLLIARRARALCAQLARAAQLAPRIWRCAPNANCALCAAHNANCVQSACKVRTARNVRLGCVFAPFRTFAISHLRTFALPRSAASPGGIDFRYRNKCTGSCGAINGLWLRCYIRVPGGSAIQGLQVVLFRVSYWLRRSLQRAVSVGAICSGEGKVGRGLHPTWMASPPYRRSWCPVGHRRDSNFC